MQGKLHRRHFATWAVGTLPCEQLPSKQQVGGSSPSGQAIAANMMFANYGVQQVKLLRDAGADVGYVLPREGALAWLDCWAITAACTRTDLAHTWLDHMLSASVGRRLTQRQGLANTVEPLPTAVAEGRVVWLEPVEDEVRRAALWRRIMSGERPERLR
jgi:putative spermidine/putrescine transport system substrate-binding protein